MAATAPEVSVKSVLKSLDALGVTADSTRKQAQQLAAAPLPSGAGTPSKPAPVPSK